MRIGEYQWKSRDLSVTSRVASGPSAAATTGTPRERSAETAAATVSRETRERDADALEEKDADRARRRERSAEPARGTI